MLGIMQVLACLLLCKAVIAVLLSYREYSPPDFTLISCLADVGTSSVRIGGPWVGSLSFSKIIMM
jgi:hypothetical protein